ncbi:hypothetical protein ACFL31_03360 [Candidatus Margulisiibacteriota bacterium]
MRPDLSPEGDETIACSFSGNLEMTAKPISGPRDPYESGRVRFFRPRPIRQALEAWGEQIAERLSSQISPIETRLNLSHDANQQPNAPAISIRMSGMISFTEPDTSS